MSDDSFAQGYELRMLTDLMDSGENAGFVAEFEFVRGCPIGVGGGSPAPSNDKVPSAGRRRGQQRGPPETNAVDPTAVQLQQIPTQPAAGGVPAGSTDPKRPSRERRPLVAQ